MSHTIPTVTGSSYDIDTINFVRPPLPLVQPAESSVDSIPAVPASPTVAAQLLSSSDLSSPGGPAEEQVGEKNVEDAQPVAEGSTPKYIQPSEL